jgi:hypothetical protein
MRATAEDALRRAIRLWAECDCWELVADLIDRLPELDDEPDPRHRLAATAAQLRLGSISLDDALGSLGLVI